MGSLNFDFYKLSFASHPHAVNCGWQLAKERYSITSQHRRRTRMAKPGNLSVLVAYIICYNNDIYCKNHPRTTAPKRQRWKAGTGSELCYCTMHLCRLRAARRVRPQTNQQTMFIITCEVSVNNCLEQTNQRLLTFFNACVTSPSTHTTPGWPKSSCPLLPD